MSGGAHVTHKLLTTAQAEDLTGGAITARDLQRRARLGDLPPGIVVRLGRRVFIAEARYLEFLEAGGQPLAGGWRRSPAGEAAAR